MIDADTPQPGDEPALISDLTPGLRQPEGDPSPSPAPTADGRRGGHRGRGAAELKRIVPQPDAGRGIVVENITHRYTAPMDKLYALLDRKRCLEPRLREKLGLVSHKSKLADAIRYALSRWAGLSLFLDDGRVEIDSNIVERRIRLLALNRKNALFAGSDGGGQHWAVIASLIDTRKLVGVEPHAYLADVTTRIVEDHPQRRLDDLLPWAYPAMPALKAVA